MSRWRARRAVIAARRAEAVRLRASGMTLQRIADRLGYCSRGAVSSELSRQLRDNPPPPAVQAEARQLELMRLDAMQYAIWDAVCAGDYHAVTAFLRISDLRCRLLGLHPPVRVAARVGPHAPVEFAELVRETQQRRR